MVGENGVGVVRFERLHGGEEGSDRLGVFNIGRRRAELFEHLCKSRSTESLLATGEVEEDEDGRSAVVSELRGPSERDVLDGGKGSDDDRHRRSDLSRIAFLVLPLHLHRH